MIKCTQCGHIIEDMDKPMICPICGGVMEPIIQEEKINEDGETEIEERSLDVLSE